jgi:class 3 adenylate cyclase
MTHAADMVGYSALAQKNETLALELLDEHRMLPCAAFARHGGREIETVGDGLQSAASRCGLASISVAWCSAASTFTATE